MKKSLWLTGIAAVFMVRAGEASIQYNAERNIIWVADYPESFPCSLDRVLKADRLHGWGVVTYEASNDTYTVNAELRIGADSGSDTYFLIGDTDHIKPTIIMTNDLVVMNGKKAIEMAGSKNLLSIGSRHGNSITPVLRFAAGRGLYCSQVPADKQPKDPLGRTFTSGGPGADVEIYNTLITCSQPDNKFGGCWLRGNSIVLKETRILRSAESVYLHSQEKQPVIENVVLEDCNTGFGHFWGWQGTSAKGCVFRNCRTALSNPNRVLFQNCRFENNVQNWTIENAEKVGFLDCSLGVPQKESEIKTGEVEINSSLTFEVKDSRGNPVANARITARDAQNQLQQQAFSGKDGKATIVLAEKKIAGSGDVTKPAVTQYAYALSVSADKFKPIEIPPIDLNDKSVRPVVLTAIE